MKAREARQAREDAPAGVRADHRLRTEQILWLVTVRPDGQPQASPVWFLWDGVAFLVFSQPAARKLRNLSTNPRASVHLDSDGACGDVVTIEGTATVEQDLPARKREAYLAKYRQGIDAIGSTPEQLAKDYSVAITIRPERARAW
jgi:PPOX class probable F420-dependent enzyme